MNWGLISCLFIKYYNPEYIYNLASNLPLLPVTVAKGSFTWNNFLWIKELMVLKPTFMGNICDCFLATVSPRVKLNFLSQDSERVTLKFE